MGTGSAYQVPALSLCRSTISIFVPPRGYCATVRPSDERSTAKHWPEILSQFVGGHEGKNRSTQHEVGNKGVDKDLH
jgi:hypothetical protein